MLMGYGDAFVYCFIITEDVATQVIAAKKEILDIRMKLDIIHDDHKAHPEPSPARYEAAKALLDRQAELYDHIHVVCKYPIAFYHVATDDWMDAWQACSKFNCKVSSVARFLKETKGKLWHGEDIGKHGGKALCICLPSHYDTDDEFILDMLGVEDYREYNKSKGIGD